MAKERFLQDTYGRARRAGTGGARSCGRMTSLRGAVAGVGEFGVVAEPTVREMEASDGTSPTAESLARRLLLAENALAVLQQTMRHDRSLADAELKRRAARITELERGLKDAQASVTTGQRALERQQAASRAKLDEARSAVAAERLQLQGRIGDLVQALEAAESDMARQARQARHAGVAHEAEGRSLRRAFASQAAAAAAARAEVRRLQARIAVLERPDASAPAQSGSPAGSLHTELFGPEDAPPQTASFSPAGEAALAGRPTTLEGLAANRLRPHWDGSAGVPYGWDGAFPLPGHMTALSDLALTTEPLDVTVSVVIPTLNAGDEFVWLLRKLRAQMGVKGLEIVIVDSGSADRTLELARTHGCTMVHLAKAEFSHSHARNLGADAASGDLLLFMVQDAYPMGDYWLHALARALLHPASEADRVSAVSATEYPRSDSELLYNALSDSHYRFLGCHSADRIGRLTGEDNHSVRSQGQLSDITCLIPRQLFLQYRYHGRYAEDLLLGIQLVREGHKVAMVSSVRTIHSHNRPTGYYVKRVFVDVIFLTEVFPDFGVPPALSVVGTVVAGYALQSLLQTWRPEASRDCASAMNTLIALVEDVKPPSEIPELRGGDGFGYTRLAEWIDGYAGRTGQPLSAADVHDAEHVRRRTVERLNMIKVYATGVHEMIDAEVANELKNAALKVLAMAVGVSLAFIHLNTEATGGGDQRLAQLRPIMLDGV